MSQTTMTIVILATFLIAATVVLGHGEAPPPNAGLFCGANLGVCFAALKEGGKPSEECCTSLSQAVKTDLKCLCNFLLNPQLLAMYGLTVEKALLIPKSCGIEGGSSMCSDAKAPSPHGAPPVSGPPPKNDKGDATKVAETGLVGIVLVMISMIFY